MNLDMSFIPDGKSGDWSVETFSVSKKDNISQQISFMKTGRNVPEGTYKRLKKGNTTVMSNTPDEIRDFRWFFLEAKGSILINGLGLGCCVKFLLDNPEVTKITVIEISEDVIKLIAPYFKDERLNIIHADALEYKPTKGEKFDCVWHDIWDNICIDNLAEMAILHRKYGRRTKCQDSWCKDYCLDARQREKQWSW